MWSSSTATLNWATDRLATTGYATYGLTGDRLYRYRVFLGRAGVDLLGSDPSPVFRTQVPVGSTQPDSFAVIGDLGVARPVRGRPGLQRRA
jgi:hypothetical protein